MPEFQKQKIEKRKGRKARCFHKHSQKRRNPHARFITEMNDVSLDDYQT